MQTLYFTSKEWNRFDWNKQQILTKRYSVILLDYKTRKEKIIQILNEINFKNLNKGIDMFNKAIQQFGDSMDKISGEISTDAKKSNELSQVNEEKNKQNLKNIWGKQRKIQNNAVKIWSDPPKTETDRGVW